jgi:hypothetical protein
VLQETRHIGYVRHGLVRPVDILIDGDQHVGGGVGEPAAFISGTITGLATILEASAYPDRLAGHPVDEGPLRRWRRVR